MMDIQDGHAAQIDRVLDAARRRIAPRVDPSRLSAVARRALIVDIRPLEQRLRDGELPDTIRIDRNVLEWRLDPTSSNRSSKCEPRLLPERPIAVGAAVVIAVYSIAELLPRQPWRPQSLWQVPEGFRRTQYVGSMAFLWGVPLGFGWATATITAGFFGVFLAMAVMTPSAALAAAVTFGLARATTLLLTVGGENFDAVADRFLRIAGHTRLARVTTAVLGTALAVGLAIPN